MQPAWIDRSERRLRWLAVPGLATFLAAMNGVVGVLSLAKPEFPAILMLDPHAVRAGEVWRTLTFLFVPQQMSNPLWLALWLVVFYAFASRLERAWGDFRFTLYCLLGAAGLVAASMLTGRVVSNSLFQTSVFLAFARMNPHFEILIFFVIPAKMRWLWLAAWVLLLLQLLAADLGGKIIIALSVLNYALFFGREDWRDARYALRRRLAP